MLPGSNADKDKKGVRQVTVGKVRKKPFLIRAFEGKGEELWRFLIDDVLIPAFKSTVSDVVDNTKDMLLFGETARDSKRARKPGGVGYISYNTFGNRKERERVPPVKANIGKAFDDVVLDTRADAEEVLTVLTEYISVYDVATIADFYATVGLNSEWSDHNYGWYDLREAGVKRIREGWIVIMPRPVPVT